MKTDISEKNKPKTAVRSLENTLHTVNDILELLVNYMVLLCIVTALAAAIGALDSPFWYWIIPAVLPFYYWILRQKTAYLSLFLLLHLPAALGMGIIGLNLPQHRYFWAAAYIVSAVVYTFNSIYVRIRERKADSLPTGLAMTLAVISFFVSTYMKSDAGNNRILVFTLLYVFLWLMRTYVQRFENYLLTNRNAAGAMPERSILQISIQNVLMCSTAAVAALAVLIWSPVSGWLTEQAKKFGLLLLKGLAALISLLASDKPDEEKLLEQAMSEGPQQLGEMVQAAEAPWWLQLLEQLLYLLGIAIAVGVVVLIIIAIARYLMEGFYEKRSYKKEVLVEGFLEEEEHIGRKQENKQSRLPVLGGTPEQKIRRIFWKTVTAEYEQLGDQKPDLSQTARQFAQKFSGDKAKEWEELAALYEKARYGKDSVTREDCRQASALARRIRR